MEGALGRAEAVMNGQQVVHDRSAAFAQCRQALKALPEAFVCLQSAHGNFLVPQCMVPRDHCE